MSRASPPQPGKDRLSACGNPPCSGPLRMTGAASRRNGSNSRRRSSSSLVRWCIRPLQGRRHADDEGDRFGAGPFSVLLMAAEETRLKLGIAAHDEGADPLRAMKFVSADGQRGDTELAEGDWHLPCRGRRIAVKRNIGKRWHERFDWLDRAGFVVGEHDGRQARPFAFPAQRRGAKHIQLIHASLRRHRHRGERIALFCECANRLQHRRMLDGTGDDGTGYRACQPKNGEIVRLRGAAGKDDFIRIGVEMAGDLLAGIFDGLARLSAKSVAAGRIAGAIHIVGLHRFPGRGRERSGRVVVEVDGVHRMTHGPAGGTGFPCVPVILLLRRRSFSGPRADEEEIQTNNQASAADHNQYRFHRKSPGG